MQLPNLSVLAPAVVACMARIPKNTAADGAPDLVSKVLPSGEALPVRDSVPNCGVATAELGSQPRERTSLKSDTAKAETNRNLETRKLNSAEPTSADVAKVNSAALPQSMPQPPSDPLGGSSGGRGRQGSVLAAATAIRTNADMEAGEYTATAVETTRGAKRQRSSDQISPGSMAADKKVCLTDEPTEFRATLRGTDGATDLVGEAGAKPSYAAAVKLYRVVVQDKGGVMMDELRATLLRKTIDRAQYQLFKNNRGKPKAQRRLPVFWQLPRLTRGCLRMTPRDDFTLEWLSSTVEQLPSLWEGSGGFRVIPESELPRYHTGIIYVPDFGEDKEDLERWPFVLREFLSELNSNVNIEEWPIFKHLVRQRGETYNHILVMGVPPEDVERLKCVDYRLGYTTGSVYVKIKASKSGNTVPAAAGAEGGDRTVSNRAVASVFADTGADTVPQEDKEWTREELDRLLEVGDGDEEDLSGEIMGLNILSPPSLMDMERPPSVHTLDN